MASRRLVMGLALGTAVLLVAVVARARTTGPSTLGSFPVAVAVDQQTGRAFVANYGSNTISVLDTATGSILRAVDVPRGPLAIAVDERAARVVVVCAGVDDRAGYVNVLDATTGAVVRATQVGVTPAMVAVDERLGRAFVLNLSSESVSVLNIASGRVIRTTPIHLTSRGLGQEYPACQGVNDINTCYSNGVAGRVSGLTTSGGQQPQRQWVARQSPGGLVVDVTRHRLFVVGTLTNSVSVLDTRSGALLRTITVGKAPCAIALDPPTGRIFVTNLDSNSVSVISPSTGAVFRTIPVGKAPGPVALDTRTRHVFVGNYGDGTVSMLDAQQATMLQSVSVGLGPNALGINARAGQVIVVTLSADANTARFPRGPGHMSVLDARNGTTIEQQSLIGNGPNAIAIDENKGRAFLVSAEQPLTVPAPLNSSWIDRARSWLPSFFPARPSWQRTGGLTILATQ